MSDVCRALIAEQGIRAFDELAGPYLSPCGRHALRFGEAARSEYCAELRLFVARQAAADEPLAPHEIDVGASNVRELLRDAVVQREAERDGREHFGITERCGFGSDEKELAFYRYDVAPRFPCGRRAYGRVEPGWERELVRPARCRRRRASRIGDEGELRAKILSVA